MILILGLIIRAETGAPVTDVPRGRGHWFGHRATHR